MTDIESSADKKLDSIFSEKQDKFLNYKHKAKYLTEFKVGKNEVVIYGNMMVGAKRSSVMNEMLDRFVDSSPPYHLMTHIDVEERALQAVWLYIHGFDSSGTIIDKLNITEIFSMFDIMWYFNLYSDDFNGFHDNWSYVLTITVLYMEKEEIISIKDKLIEMLNKLISNFRYGFKQVYSRIVAKLLDYKLDDITDSLDFIILATEDISGARSYNDVIDKKSYQKHGSEWVPFLESKNPVINLCIGDWKRDNKSYKLIVSKGMFVLKKITF